MKIIVLVVSLFFCAGTFAGAEQTGKITRLLVHHNASTSSDVGQRVIIRLEADITDGFCTDKKYWGMYLKNEAEKAQYSMLLASYMAGRKVKIWGNPDENCINNNERVRNVEVVE